MKPTIVGVDLAKSVFEVAVSRRAGKVTERKRLSRSAFEKFFRHLPPATVLLEACGSAHHWARKLHSFGHEVGPDTLLARLHELIEDADSALPDPMRGILGDPLRLAERHRKRGGTGGRLSAADYRRDDGLRGDVGE